MPATWWCRWPSCCRRPRRGGRDGPRPRRQRATAPRARSQIESVHLSARRAATVVVVCAGVCCCCASRCSGSRATPRGRRVRRSRCCCATHGRRCGRVHARRRLSPRPVDARTACERVAVRDEPSPTRRFRRLAARTRGLEAVGFGAFSEASYLSSPRSSPSSASSSTSTPTSPWCATSTTSHARCSRRRSCTRRAHCRAARGRRRQQFGRRARKLQHRGVGAAAEPDDVRAPARLPPWRPLPLHHRRPDGGQRLFS